MALECAAAHEELVVEGKSYESSVPVVLFLNEGKVGYGTIQ